MTKADLVECIFESIDDASKTESAEMVETVFSILKKTLEQGEKIKISGFGTFTVNHKKARKGRNPQTGERITISGRRVLTFKPSQVLKRRMNF